MLPALLILVLLVLLMQWRALRRLHALCRRLDVLQRNLGHVCRAAPPRPAHPPVRLHARSGATRLHS